MEIPFLFLIAICIQLVTARIHKLEIGNDTRKYIALSTFGFYKGGILNVQLKQFHVEPHNIKHDIFGFSLDRKLSDAMNPYLDGHQEKCVLEEGFTPNEGAIHFIMDFKKKQLKISSSDKGMVKIYQDKEELEKKMKIKQQNYHSLPIYMNETYISTEFIVYIDSEKNQGLYSLYFHNCPNYNISTINKLSFEIIIEENNQGNYLSAGEMPLPALYFMMAIIFCLSGSFWVFILCKSKHPVFKIHYLMALLVYLKSLSLLFHGINYHFIEIKGEHVAAWAILYYITHLLKGSVLFIVIVLVGTGWTFIKHILSEKDKKIFMIVIPLQVLANVAEIILEESEEGDAEHHTWWDIFTLVDLLCCGAILFPVVWSIRHLQDASQTDGKAAQNLRKLKLFRHFYIMIVCYIYFTRIIVYLLKLTVPFQYEWMDEMFREIATYVFFVLTGYKFRPASANPYFQVPSNEEDSEEEMDIVISDKGLAEGLKKISRATGSSKKGNSEEEESILRHESSHDLD